MDIYVNFITVKFAYSQFQSVLISSFELMLTSTNDCQCLRNLEIINLILQF